MNKPVKGFETDALLIGETHYEENYGVISINTDSSQLRGGGTTSAPPRLTPPSLSQYSTHDTQSQ